MFKGYSGYSIRTINETDLPFLAELRNDPDTWMYLHTLKFANEPRQKDWWIKSSLDPHQQNFIFSDGFKSIGFVRMDEIDHQNRSIRVGGDVHRDFRGKGYSKEMYKVIFKYAFDYLNMHRVWLLVLSYNIPAISLYKKIGFKEEGVMRDVLFRDGVYSDNIIMSILEDEWRELQH